MLSKILLSRRWEPITKVISAKKYTLTTLLTFNKLSSNGNSKYLNPERN